MVLLKTFKLFFNDKINFKYEFKMVISLLHYKKIV